MLKRLASNPVVLIGGFIAVSGAVGHFYGSALTQWLTQLRDIGVLGDLVLFFLTMLVAMIGILPASLLGITGGAIYGLGLGFLLTSTGIMTGALLSFALARSRLRDWLLRQKAVRRGVTLVEHSLCMGGWKAACLIRLSPVMPFSLTSYGLGLSSINLRDYMIGTAASLPALALYVAAGHSGMTKFAPLQDGLLLLGALATIWITKTAFSASAAASQSSHHRI
jgi:uncharacterized membrane protein YdjX (TVP38/TMEM64 family)